MFEKEAEEYREKEKDKGYYWVTQEMEQSELDTIVDETFKDGAEFGYNKAKEWHYVKEGDLPLQTTLVLIKACGCFILGWLDDNDVWHNDSDNGARIPKDNIYAWKEIEPPKQKLPRTCATCKSKDTCSAFLPLGRCELSYEED